MPLRIVTIKLDEKLLEKIDKKAMLEKRSRSDVIRGILEKYFEEQERGKRGIKRVRIY